MSKVKCFVCHKFGHYAVQCPNKKKKQVAASADMEQFASKFDREFSLIACLSSCSGTSRVWYIDSGASTHMSGVRECFSELNERGVDVEVELGDDGNCQSYGERDNVVLEGVLSSFEVSRRLLCPWATEELDINFYYRGQGV